MKKTINSEHITGRVYQHELVVKKVQNQSSENFGKEFISGKLSVAVDEDGMNVIDVHYTYVTETTSKGGKNSTYTALKNIIDNGKTWVANGKDEATKVKIDTSLALNDFYDRNGELVSAKRNEGGFVTIVSDIAPDAKTNDFEFDMVITNVRNVEADVEKGIEKPYDVVKGAIFNFRNDLLPVELVVKNPTGMAYFEDLGATNSNPIFTKVWGKINTTTSKKEFTEDSAFGEASVRVVERTTREWVITGTAKVPYDFGDEAVITAEDLTKAAQAREVHLAEVKKRNDEYLASQSKTAPSPAAAAVASGNFNF
jgi:hypothetical protein